MGACIAVHTSVCVAGIDICNYEGLCRCMYTTDHRRVLTGQMSHLCIVLRGTKVSNRAVCLLNPVVNI